MKSVAGKNVLVTGAAMGMGRLFADRAVAEHARSVVLWDVNEKALNETLATMDTGSSAVSGYIVDLGDPEQVRVTAEAVLADLGEIHVLINNAGVVRGNSFFWETDSVRDTKLTIDVNTLAPMYVAREFLPTMIASPQECRLVNLASAAGFTPGSDAGGLAVLPPSARSRSSRERGVTGNGSPFPFGDAPAAAGSSSGKRTMAGSTQKE